TIICIQISLQRCRKQKTAEAFLSSAVLSSHQRRLFQVDFCSLLFQFSLDLLSLCLGNSLFQYLRSVVNKLFCFFQSKTCDLTYSLDNLNLGSTRRYELYIELILFFCCCSLSACCCNYNACCCRYAELFFTSFYKLV